MKNNRNNNNNSNKETRISTSSSVQSLRPRWPKSREVSSRFLSPTSTASTDKQESPMSSLIRGNLGTYKHPRKHRSVEESSMFFRDLWPQSKTDHLQDLGSRHKVVLPGIENATTNNNNKSDGHGNAWGKKGDRHNDVDNSSTVGGSMRFVGELKFSRNYLPSGRESVHSSVSDSMNLTPQRSVSDRDYESESELSDSCSGIASSCSSTPRFSSTDTLSFRRWPREASSKHAYDRSPKTGNGRILSSRREMNILNPNGKTSKSSLHNTVKRANSSRADGNTPTKTEWALAGRRTTPANGASTAKGVGSFISSGLVLFNNDKSLSSASSSSSSSPVKSRAGTETTHRLRLLYNGLIKWRYANAEADATNQNLSNQAQRNMLYACNGLRKLQCSVLKKKLQLEKDKHEMKLNFTVHSQIDALEAWGHMERQHLAAVSRTKEGLNSVVCRVPLIEGSKAETKSTWSALRHALDLASSVKSLLTVFMPQAETLVQSVSELAEVVSMEKSLLPECFEYLKIISLFQLQEGSLRCGLAQTNNFQRQHSNSSNDQVCPSTAALPSNHVSTLID